jgi:hypothetical protein
MNRVILLCTVLLIAMGALHCPGKKVMVPPRIDLKDFEVLGIIEFTSNKQGKMADLTTQRFMDMAREDQGIVRIIDLGTQKAMLKEIGENKLDQEAYGKIGAAKNVATLIVGQLTVSDVRPDITLTPGLGVMSFAADVDAALSVQMIEASTGATLWSSSSKASERVGEVTIFGLKDFAFDADEPDKAYGKLVDELVWRVTHDFRVRWVRE